MYSLTQKPDKHPHAAKGTEKQRVRVSRTKATAVQARVQGQTVAAWNSTPVDSGHPKCLL